MKGTQHSRAMIVIVAALMVCLSTALFVSAQQTAKKEHVFRGKVEKVDEKGKILTVNGENVPGWMNAMTMNYSVDKEEVLKKVKVGDQITAKVYDGDFKVLYDVQVVPAKDTKPPEKK